MLPVDRYGRARSRAARCGDQRPHHPGHADARQQRGGHDPAAGRAIRRVRAHRGVLIHLDAVQAAPYMAHRHSASWTSTCCRSRRTSSRDPRASARCTCATARSCCRRCRAARRSAIGRAGTENVAGAVGMAVGIRPGLRRAGRACAPAGRASATACAMRCWPCPNVELTGHPRKRLPGHLSRHRCATRRARRWSARSTWPASRPRPARRARPARPSRRTS